MRPAAATSPPPRPASAARPDTDLNLVGSSSWTTAERPTLNPSPVYNVLTPEGPKTEVRTVIANSALTTGGPDPETADSPLQVRQRFAAETALLATGGTTPISVVALPPRDWDVEGSRTAAIASDLTLPWIAPTDVGQIVAAHEDAADHQGTQRTARRTRR